ncbi:hypothetical protein D3C85_1692020 [compost metagenome]
MKWLMPNHGGLWSGVHDPLKSFADAGPADQRYFARDWRWLKPAASISPMSFCTGWAVTSRYS